MHYYVIEAKAEISVCNSDVVVCSKGNMLNEIHLFVNKYTHMHELNEMLRQLTEKKVKSIFVKLRTSI